MNLAIIVAVAKNGVIGHKNQLPWHLPDDLKYFKAVTFGKPVIMGRKTYESIGRPLPGRTNIVVTRDAKWQATKEVIVAPSIEVAIREAEIVLTYSPHLDGEAMVIGGSEIYQSTLSLVDKIYLTRICNDFEGDAHFPVLAEHEWILESALPGSVDAAIPHEFLIYKKLRN